MVTFEDVLVRYAGLPEQRLSEPWRWPDRDGATLEVRDALLRSLELELGALAAAGSGAGERSRAVALGQAAFGDLRGLLCGLPDALLDAEPGDGAWTLRRVLQHVLWVERRYQLQTAYAASRSDDDPARVEPHVPFEDAPSIAAWVQRLSAAREEGRRALTFLDDKLGRPSVWTGHAVDVRFRLHRFTGHLEQHTIQCEKCCATSTTRSPRRGGSSGGSRPPGAATNGSADRRCWPSSTPSTGRWSALSAIADGVRGLRVPVGGRACHMRIAVIGAGVLGAAAAARLASGRHAVTLIDAGAPGSGSSGASFSWINANEKVPRDYFDLNVAGMAAHRDGPWLHRTGRLQWVATDAERHALAEKDHRLRSWGYRVESLSAAAARRLEPDVAIPDGVEVSFYPDEGFVWPAVYLAHLLDAASAAGAVLLPHAPVVRFLTAGGRVTGVELAAGDRIEADVCVCCCGRWTQEVSALAGVHVPLVPAEDGSPVFGLLGLTAPVPASVSRVVASPRLNVRPDGAGRLLLHALDLDGAARPDEARASELFRRAGELVPRARGVGLDTVRVCARPLPADGRTVAGWARGAAGLYVLVTHSGITLAPLLATLAESEIAGGRDEPALRPFRPERFAAV
jgi:D-hydroxyproline dehydrogenase subunit beta